MKEGDSIGLIPRHESSPADELGRCHPDRWMFCKGSPFMQQRNALQLVPNAEPKEAQKEWNRAEKKSVSQYERRLSQ